MKAHTKFQLQSLTLAHVNKAFEHSSNIKINFYHNLTIFKIILNINITKHIENEYKIV